MRITVFLFLVQLTLMISCGEREQVNTSNPKSVTFTNDTHVARKESLQPLPSVDTTNALRIYVNSNGTILADDIAVSRELLNSKLKALKDSHGLVYYSRDNALTDPTKESMQVMELVTKY